MAATRYGSTDLRRQVGSPRAKGRENKDTVCRNMVIYGHCRFADQGCTFNHDQNKHFSPQPDFNSRRAFNVESPSFTPSVMSNQHAGKKSTLSSQAASAAPFTPWGASTPQQHNTESSTFNLAAIREFTPQHYDAAINNSGKGMNLDTTIYNDPFTSMGSIGQVLPSTSTFNPYANDNMNNTSGATFYQHQGAYGNGPLMPPSYHLYQPIESYRQDLQPWQKTTYDFFMPAKIREELHKKMLATQQVIPNSVLPQLERWHSLVPLDTNNRKNSTSFGYPSWVYKAQSSRNGKHYALRRLEGYRLTNENAILVVMKEWKNIKSASIVTVYEAFTTREFGDSSLIFVYDFHPLAKTLQEYYFQSAPGTRFRSSTPIQETVLWGYICQIANALKTIHSAKLAARCLELSKILVSEKGRIRLAGCSILDVVQFGANTQSIEELQQEDLFNFGKVVLSLATNTPPAQLNNPLGVVDSLGTKYSAKLKDAITWLLTPAAVGESDIKLDRFIAEIAFEMTHFFDLALQDNDEKQFHLSRELENGRVARNAMKLLSVCERGDLPNSPSWSETGERYQLKLFRDYVFHQVQADGKPSLAIGHMLTCMSKLDAGIDETIILTSRDNETIFVISYRELKQMFDRAFNELVSYSKHDAPGAN
ncbi:PAB-dependent poly(A)-specific ribonuclease subunit PAN3 [Bombardia bombarda]|uniref:PAN2-PAN3 deadenylation complex subunit PAN3 n=1 Tax=Bombardia bombarda TaxID=252184 RepID=A0AA39WCC1_9PEZI|nr:PAB-dependent poly(A)-specific ribonuclease subunit PAN3 [Bombardia bombarda]